MKLTRRTFNAMLAAGLAALPLTLKSDQEPPKFRGIDPAKGEGQSYGVVCIQGLDGQLYIGDIIEVGDTAGVYVGNNTVLLETPIKLSING